VILDIDIGNTRGKWRLRTATETHDRGVLDIKADVAVGLREFYNNANLADHKIEKILLSSVMDAERNEQLDIFFKEKMAIAAQFAKSKASWRNLTNGYYHPEKLGVDRWLAMIAAFHENNTACIVVDCGTAITVDAIDAAGSHRGGFIAPGFGAMHQALFSATLIPPLLAGESNSSAPGNNTASAIGNARLAMLSGLIQEAERILSVGTGNPLPLVVATGGDAAQVKKIYPDALTCPELVLDGLALFFDTFGQAN
jgi:type III pantothenate kinase